VFVHAGLVREHLKYLELHYQNAPQEESYNNDANDSHSNHDQAGGSSSGVEIGSNSLWAKAAMEARESATAAGKTAASVVSLC